MAYADDIKELKPLMFEYLEKRKRIAKVIANICKLMGLDVSCNQTNNPSDNYAPTIKVYSPSKGIDAIVNRIIGMGYSAIVKRDSIRGIDYTKNGMGCVHVQQFNAKEYHIEVDACLDERGVTDDNKKLYHREIKEFGDNWKDWQAYLSASKDYEKFNDSVYKRDGYWVVVDDSINMVFITTNIGNFYRGV